MVNIHIQKLSTKQVNTRNGLKNVWGIYDGKQWYSSFMETWNSAWKIGDTLTLDDSQVIANTKGDKTFWNINAPRRNNPAAAPVAAVGNPMLLDAIFLNTKKILNYLEHLPVGSGGLTLGEIMAEPKMPVKKVEDAPPPEDTTDYSDPENLGF